MKAWGRRVGTGSWGSLTVVALVLMATTTAMATSMPGSVDGGAPSVSAKKVCGTLTPDATYTTEVAFLGTEHACEHLRGRQFVATKADLVAMKAAHKAAVASLVTTDPAVIGAWSTATNPGTKTIGISAVMLHTGKVLLFGGKYKATDKNTAAYLFDPVTGTGHEVPAPAAVFCGSVAQLADGRVLSVGGTNKIPQGIVDVWIFDPVTEQWIRQPDTPLGRYYPTSTKLADGTVVTTAGTELDGVTKNPTVELYTPPAPGSDVGTMQVVGPSHVTGYYPRQWLMPDGNLLQVDGRNSYRLDTQTWQWTNLLGLPPGNGAGSAGLMLPGGPDGTSRVLMIGGLKGGTAVTSTEKYDYSNPAGGWSYGNPMPTQRAHMNVVQVPDGSAYGIGGNSSGLYNVGQFQTMRYDPSADTWTNMAVQSPRRGYHSTAVLLPDGRIMSAGDTGAGGGRQLIDFYSPPYLFQGPRPVISAAPSSVAYGNTFSISTSGAPATRAVLMAPGATTHADEMNARRVELAVTPTADGFTATAPGPRVAPPGYYMLFTVTADGIPSVASWVHVGP
jgi:Domain of unknown function (DUF1929)/Kelch motif